MRLRGDQKGLLEEAGIPPILNTFVEAGQALYLPTLHPAQQRAKYFQDLYSI